MGLRGLGTYPDAAELGDPTLETVHLTATHAFSEPGTYFPALRVASQREGNPNTTIHPLDEPQPGPGSGQRMKGRC
jgi:hypothetical protein